MVLVSGTYIAPIKPEWPRLNDQTSGGADCAGETNHGAGMIDP